MFDDFKEEVPVGYKIIKNVLTNNNIGHAYLIETNSYKRKNEFVMSLAKALICPFKYTNFEKCRNCDICKQIDNNEFLELKVINPLGSMIRKDELNQLQIDFSVKPVIGNKKVYIINDADRMNQISANSLLKFLEEPEEGIYAIITVSSIDKIIDTIVSRCQIIRLNNTHELNDLNSMLISTMTDEKKEEFNKILDNEKEEMFDIYLNFINSIEFNGISTLCFEKRLLNLLKNKEDVELFFNFIIIYYEELLNYRLSKKINLFPGKYLPDIEKISFKNSYKEICMKIKKIVNIKSNILVNANTHLLVDRLVIELVR